MKYKRGDWTAKALYGLVESNGRLLGGISNPELFTLTQARQCVRADKALGNKPPRIVKIRIVHEIVDEDVK